MSMTKKEIQADLDATIRDLTRLDAITENLHHFIYDSHGEDRSKFKIQLFTFDGLRSQAGSLKTRIEETLAKL